MLGDVSATLVSCAASSLLVGLLDRGSDSSLVEVARTRTAVYYETGRDDLPVLCVCTTEAVRNPASVVAPCLPAGPCAIRDGVLTSRTTRWQVLRWWTPPRPRGLTPPVDVPAVPGVAQLERLIPLDLVGSGPGLTPEGDDVLAGALVAAHATCDPRLRRWRAEACEAVRLRRTTVVSRALLQHATDGYAIAELAAFVVAVCAGDAAAATRALLAVGHTSGAALACGALHVLSTDASTRERAA
jgi:hypothetical protein